MKRIEMKVSENIELPQTPRNDLTDLYQAERCCLLLLFLSSRTRVELIAFEPSNEIEFFGPASHLSLP